MPDNISKVISSLSYDQYVLIDCLKFNKEINPNAPYSRSYSLDFVALSKQGFLNVYNEMINSVLYLNESTYFVPFELKIFDDKIVLQKNELVITIKYYKVIKNINELIELPGLDFYKCCYDGEKMYCTDEAIQCHKTGKVNYVGNIYLSPIGALNNIFIPECLQFKSEFLEANRNYFTVIANTISLKHRYRENYKCEKEHSGNYEKGSFFRPKIFSQRNYAIINGLVTSLDLPEQEVLKHIEEIISKGSLTSFT
jgi:hypothetical protein